MAVVENGVSNNHVESNDVDRSESVRVSRSNDRNQTNGVLNSHKSDEDLGFKKEIRDLEEMLSKLNPMAEEFVPPSLSNNNAYNHINNININGVVLQSPPPPPPPAAAAAQFGYGVVNEFMMQSNHTGFGNINGVSTGRKGNYGNGKRRLNSRTNMAQQEDAIKRTIHVSDIDQQVTEEQLAALFVSCGQVVDCRVCGDPNSVLRFAFIEFTDEEGAKNALSLAGTMLGYYPLRVLPSKTAIAPVNPTFLPRSEDEREMCARTIYCTNIDKKVTQADVKLFFETFCGEVYRLRLLGDYHHSSRIAFVEFVMAESAIAALNCSGAVLGSLPIRVSPSKTPVRPRTTRPTMN
ncbi:polyadenylate-binding protein-interacting protein 11 isoform X2 [Helianthus annuus]|uniref:polyadenylate-binding protein-interacting protein 11 isoform X2 n=1 Tax=Helianthus annuus TaxID=4232 RepID=UPI000B901D8F|nr:polyadenylate-binding protein-interacting protein 11 isoform X2 [Helianthus annuus]